MQVEILVKQTIPFAAVPASSLNMFYNWTSFNCFTSFITTAIILHDGCSYNFYFFIIINLSYLLLSKLSERNDMAKITDVGISKATKDITGTLAGTPVYIAPEVFHSAVYDSKADIYSLGILLWEMWYGQQAFAEFKVTTITALFKCVDEGYRPTYVKGCKKPPVRWKEMMEKCWQGNPDQRPSADWCYKETTYL